MPPEYSRLVIRGMYKNPALWGLILCTLLCGTCSQGGRHADKDAFEVALKWNEYLLELDRFSEGYRPPVSARMFAYCGIAAWESVLPHFSDAVSCSNTWKDLRLPTWDKTHEFVPAAALNAVYKSVSQLYFPHTFTNLKNKSEALFSQTQKDLIGQYSAEAVLASEAHGRAVAEAVFKWSATDLIGHQAFLFNFDRNFHTSPVAGQWHDEHSPPLLPYWGQARTFLSPVPGMEFHAPMKFSESHHSSFFAQALEVYNLSLPLKEEHRWIAEFWSDDFSGLTFSAASRWIAITNQALKKAHPELLLALETWLKVGLALNDAAVNAWYAKYYFCVERPDAYIHRNIDKGWMPLHHTPPFPAYPSGHASFAAAAAAVLTSMLGDDFYLTDRSHQYRKEFLGKPRSFRSFQEMAEENAFSRILLGVHFRMDCEEGLRIGQMIGKNTCAFQVRLNKHKL